MEADYKPAEFRSDIALIFLDFLSPDEAVALLEKRRAVVEGILQPIQEYGKHHGGSMQLMLGTILKQKKL